MPGRRLYPRLRPGSVLCGNACVPAGGCCIGGVAVAANTPNPANACQACLPAVSPSAWSNVANGTACNDGNLCTQTDTCQNGTCTGSNPVVCQPLDQCHTAGVCDPATGLCSNPNKANGTICNDGNACTDGDTCQAGVCQSGTPKVCTTSDPCRTASCDPATGCVTTLKPAGTACGDANACNGNEVCDAAGNCVAGTPVTCGPCTVCDTTTGQCLPANEGNACPGDGNKCVGSFVCQSGACTGIDPVVCAAPDQCHFAGACDPATGICSNPDKPNGSFCTDANPCTSFDSCQQGVCTGSPVDCDDGLECTDDACDPVAGCTHVPKSGFCAIEGACYAPGDPNPANPCQRCDPAQAATAWSPGPAGAACNGSSQCSIATCQADGTCQRTPVDCDDGLFCTADLCDPGQGCRHSLLPGTCLIEGACYTAGGLNPEQACLHCDPDQDPRGWTVLHGTPCGDSACISGATCASGFCSGGQASTGGCAIGGVCYPAGATRPSNTCMVCDPAQSTIQWTFRANGTPCEGLCQDGGTCQFGNCTGGTVDGGFCFIEDVCIAAGATHPTRGQCLVCDPAKDPRWWTTLADDTPCTNYCLATPTCQAGVCTGEETIVCEQPDDRPFCHQSVCDPATGSCVMRPTRDGRSDTKGCEVCAGCYGGVCAGPPQPVDCGQCATCDDVTGTCLPKPAGGDCGSDCTTRRTCNAAGACIAEPGTCGLNIGCEAKVCDPATNTCKETRANDNKPCDGDPCRICWNGRCIKKTCGVCKRCDPASGQCVACDSCCGGQCGYKSCGSSRCCSPGKVCLDLGNGFTSCCDPDRLCEGKCFDYPITCCGLNAIGQPQACGAGQMCCTGGITDNCCDMATELCGLYSCIPRF